MVDFFSIRRYRLNSWNSSQSGQSIEFGLKSSWPETLGKWQDLTTDFFSQRTELQSPGWDSTILSDTSIISPTGVCPATGTGERDLRRKFTWDCSGSLGCELKQQCQSHNGNKRTEIPKFISPTLSSSFFFFTFAPNAVPSGTLLQRRSERSDRRQ